MHAILAKLGKLPVLPAVVQKVIGSLVVPNIDTATLGKEIGKDPVLSGRLLRIANSPFYGLSRQIATPQDAITVMGLSQVRALVLAAGMAQTLQARTSVRERVAHWRRSFRVANAAHTLACHAHFTAEPAFTAGMLHNIGALVIEVCLPNAYRRARENSRRHNLPLRQAERDILGFDHTEAGAEVARYWKLPDVIEQAIRNCHDPLAAAADHVASCVAVACLLDDATASGEPNVSLSLPEPLRHALPLDDATILASRPDAALAAEAARLLVGTD